MKLKKTYTYALISSLYSTLLAILIAGLSYFFMMPYFGVFSVLVVVILFFIVSFLIMQYRAEFYLQKN
jgi:two-component system phosphate regulon sensor histidine kinase PhoR